VICGDELPLCVMFILDVRVCRALWYEHLL
jgi:hypothetical protein